MARQSNIDILLQTLELRGKRVADVGCGAGELAQRMAAAGAVVTGIDPNPKRIAKARQGNGESATFIEGVGENLPFDAASLDVVVFFNSLHHVPAAAMGKALDEAARTLKAGGALYISEPVAEGSYFATARPVNDETEVRNQAIRAIRRVVAEGAFRDESEVVNRSSRVETSFESFCANLVDTDPKRQVLIDRKHDELRRLFESNGRKTAEGYEFDRATRFNLLRRL